MQVNLKDDRPHGRAASKSPTGDQPIDRSLRSARLPVHRYILFLLIVAVGLAIDLATKAWAFNWLGLPGPEANNTWWLWEGYVGVQTSVNQGALFGMGKGYSGVFAIVSIVAAGTIIYWLFVRQEARDLVLTVALAAVTAGILGNLYDRLGLWHAREFPAYFQNGVRDWILFCYKSYTWPNFNIADSMLVCGAAMLFWRAVFPPQNCEMASKS